MSKATEVGWRFFRPTSVLPAILLLYKADAFRGDMQGA